MTVQSPHLKIQNGVQLFTAAISFQLVRATLIALFYISMIRGGKDNSMTFITDVI